MGIIVLISTLLSMLNSKKTTDILPYSDILSL